MVSPGFWAGKRVFLTGHTGFKGSWLALWLQSLGAEVTGYAANSDGYDMVAPSGEGAERCMKLALQMAGNPRIDYLNPHGTSTPVGDSKEMGAVRKSTMVPFCRSSAKRRIDKSNAAMMVVPEEK